MCRTRPTDVRALQALGVAYVRKATQVADPAYYDLAQRAFDRADAVTPDLDDTNLGRGLLALSRHEFARRARPRHACPREQPRQSRRARGDGRRQGGARALRRRVGDAPGALRPPPRPARLRAAVVRPGAARRHDRRAPRDARSRHRRQRHRLRPRDGRRAPRRPRARPGQLPRRRRASTRRRSQLQPELVLAELGEARVEVARGRARRRHRPPPRAHPSGYR